VLLYIYNSLALVKAFLVDSGHGESV